MRQAARDAPIGLVDPAEAGTQGGLHGAGLPRALDGGLRRHGETF